MSAYDLTVVVPTFNERDNVREVVDRLAALLDPLEWEVVFVDDNSPDGTADLVFDISRENPRVRGIRRVGRRGLSSACIEGICSSNAPYVAVMDADLQHDERILPKMYETIREGGYDIVVGSRFTEGGSTGTMPGLRVKMSRLATWIGAKWLNVKTSDPMSGFFMLDREFFYNHVGNLSGKGFKILLDLFATAGPEATFAEVPYDMRARERGQSKLDTLVLWEYLMLLCEKSIGKFVPVRFIFFVAMGLLGGALHLAVLLTLFYRADATFLAAQGSAIAVAMTANFFLNNVFTYQDRRLRGARMLRGLLVFYLTCLPGAIINLLVASYLFEQGVHVAAAGLLGAVVGAIWNYTLSSEYAWRPAKA